MKINRSTLSYRALYLRHGIIFLVMAVLWLLLALADSSINGIALLLGWVAFIAVNIFVMTVFLVFAARRDKEDELVQENAAKTNRTFLRVLVVIGVVLFLAAGAANTGSDENIVTIPMHQGYIAAVMYLLNAVWHFIAMHYESGAGSEEADA